MSVCHSGKRPGSGKTLEIRVYVVEAFTIRRQNEVERFSPNSRDSQTSCLKYLQDGSGKQHRVQGDRLASMKL